MAAEKVEVTMLSDQMTLAEAMEEISILPVVKTLQCRHSEPWRHYHVWQHPTAMTQSLKEAISDGVRLIDGAAALAFILWHDAIYDPQASHGRNEALSAQLCSFEFGAIGHPNSINRACEAILATIGHVPPDSSICPDAEILLDCDLGILGAEQEHFDHYDACIRAEYYHVPEDIYAAKRKEILTSFLKRDRLYITEWAHEKWDEKARQNLERVIARM